MVSPSYSGTHIPVNLWYLFEKMKNDMTVISHSPYFPDLTAPADSYWFLKLKGQRFTTINEIKENLLIELLAIPRLLSTMETSLASVWT